MADSVKISDAARFKAPSAGSFRALGEGALEKELERLKSELGLGLGLKVLWLPRSGGGLSGEVKNGHLHLRYEAEGGATHPEA